MNILVGPQIPTLSIGGRVFTDLVNLITLEGNFNAAVNGYCTLRLPSGTAGYAVTTAKTLKIVAVELMTLVVAATGTVRIGYADTDQGVATNTAPTNPIYPAGAIANGWCDTSIANTTAYNLNFPVIAGKYIFIYNGGTAAQGAFRAYGYES